MFSELIKNNTFVEQSGKVLNESLLSIWVKKIWLILKCLLEYHCYLGLYLRAEVLKSNAFAILFRSLHVFYR